MNIFSRKKNSLSVAILSVLIAVTVLLLCACADSKTTNESDLNSPVVSQESVNVIGEGNTSFIFEVENGEQKSVYTVKTDKTNVGEALQELNMIAGDQDDFGLYVKTVDGVTLDYDKDGMYWAFYINGEYAATGVDATEITADCTYSFKAEK